MYNNVFLKGSYGKNISQCYFKNYSIFDYFIRKIPTTYNHEKHTTTLYSVTSTNTYTEQTAMQVGINGYSNAPYPAGRTH